MAEREDSHVVFTKVPRLFIKKVVGSLPKCELRESPGKGRGVFTLESVRKDRYVTIYPSHAIVRCVADMSEELEGTLQEFDTIGKLDEMKLTDELFETYSLNAHYKNLVIVGDPRVCLPHALGHMINDKARSKSEKDEHIYTKVSKLGQNVRAETMFIGENDTLPIVVMKATRNIAAGEELFYSYGLCYWRPKRERG